MTAKCTDGTDRSGGSGVETVLPGFLPVTCFRRVSHPVEVARSSL